jgi:hypothetical protein
MKEWTGVVETISDKDWNGIKLWSFKIEGEDRWFRTAKTPLDVPLGTTITFNERNSQVDLASISETTSSAPPPPPVTQTETVVSTVGSRIQWQAARRDACNVVVAALHTEALPWAKNTPKGKKLDLLRGYINELTKQFLEEENE